MLSQEQAPPFKHQGVWFVLIVWKLKAKESLSSSDSSLPAQFRLPLRCTELIEKGEVLGREHSSKQSLGEAHSIWNVVASYFQSKTSGTYARITEKIANIGENTFGADYIISFLPAYTVLHALQILFSVYCSANQDFQNVDKKKNSVFCLPRKNKWQSKISQLSKNENC